MRKLLACLFVLQLLMASPVAAKTWPHWSRPQNKQVVVQFERTKVSAAVWSHMTAAIADWSRSGRVDGVPVAKCTNQFVYCVRVTEYSRRDGRAGHTVLNHDPKTNIAWYGSIQVNTYYARSWAQRRKTACHEAGHAFGIGPHTHGSCMQDGFADLTTRPSSSDFALLQRIYAKPGG
jgi:predicted Zn-dependent protease